MNRFIVANDLRVVDTAKASGLFAKVKITTSYSGTNVLPESELEGLTTEDVTLSTLVRLDVGVYITVGKADILLYQSANEMDSTTIPFEHHPVFTKAKEKFQRRYVKQLKNIVTLSEALSAQSYNDSITPAKPEPEITTEVVLAQAAKENPIDFANMLDEMAGTKEGTSQDATFPITATVAAPRVHMQDLTEIVDKLNEKISVKSAKLEPLVFDTKKGIPTDLLHGIGLSASKVNLITENIRLFLDRPVSHI